MSYKTIKQNFERGLWTAFQVAMTVKAGIITAEQYEEITGVRYEDSLPEPQPVGVEQVRKAKLSENSKTCNQIIENEFKSDIKDDGMKPYRMNDDDQKNILGYIAMITLGLMQDPTGESLPMFEWKNSTEIECTPTWKWKEIIDFFQFFGVWKEKILKRQDAIKKQILNAEAKEELDAVEIDYSDLLVFDGGDTT